MINNSDRALVPPIPIRNGFFRSLFCEGKQPVCQSSVVSQKSRAVKTLL